MCGISAILPFGSPPAVDLEDLSRMHRMLAHRGPDGEGSLVVDTSLGAVRADAIPEECAGMAACLAFRRLRIQDLDPRSDQPLSIAGGKLWILFNGEIYNHRALRSELGGSFETSSDTEVALAAWERWGPDCFSRFDGMWAMLIVDLRRGVVAGSRDRLGIKPLAFAFDHDRLLLASEPKAIAAVMRGGPVVDSERFRCFLSGFPQPSPQATFYQGVRQVPAASWFEIQLGSPYRPPVFQRFWDLRPFTADENQLGTADEAVAMYGERLEAAVRSHLTADVPVGTLLSGGLDSSVITRLAATELAARGRAPLKTFSLIYDDPRMDESTWIKAVIAQGGLDPTLDLMEPDELFALTSRTVAAQGEPLLGQELIAQYHIYQVARSHGVPVILNGQGADEITGGYPHHESILVRALISRGQWGEAAGEVTALARKYGKPWAHALWSASMGAARARFEHRMRLRGYDWIDGGPFRFDPQALDPGLSRHGLNRHLYRETREMNMPAILSFEDRSAMAHSVEVRVPFLDHHLVELAFRLPVHWKVYRADRKRVLRAVGRRILPAAIVDRRDKKGIITGKLWLDPRRHSAALEELCQDTALLEGHGFRPGPLRRFVRASLSGRQDDRFALWRIYTAWLFLRGLRAEG